MAKPSLLTHPKFRRLTRVLGLGEAQALGHLELLWHVAYETGSAEVGDAADVEAAARWTGADGALCAALVACKLIDEHKHANGDTTFSIHDLTDHCPKYVKDKLAKRLQRQKMSETRRTKKRRVAPKENGSRKKERHVAVSLPFPTLPLPTPPLAAQEEASSSSFPTRSGAWELPPDKRAELASSFHWVDLSVELSKARAWLIANPDRRKTARGMFRFLTGWMGNVRQGTRGPRPPAGSAEHLSGIQEFVKGEPIP